MIAPQHVKPFRKGPSKDDAADAAAIVEAALRPSTPLVAVKELWQQDLQFMHRIRQDLVERRTALCNQYRGFLVECGLAEAKGVATLVDGIRDLLAIVNDAVPPMLKRWLQRFLQQFHELDGEIEMITAEIERAGRQSEPCVRLAEIPGIGLLTATALHAAMGDGAFLKNGRQTAAWLGLVPRRHGSGGKQQYLGITKAGDSYLRCMLVHGGMAMVALAKRRPERALATALRLLAHKPPAKVAVALANRNARLAWRILAKGERYDPSRAA